MYLIPYAVDIEKVKSTFNSKSEDLFTTYLVTTNLIVDFPALVSISTRYTPASFRLRVWFDTGDRYCFTSLPSILKTLIEFISSASTDVINVNSPVVGFG